MYIVSVKFYTMKGKNKFTKKDAKEIRKLLAILRESNREDQKKLRNTLRNKCCFHIRDFTQSNNGFTINDFDDLEKNGKIVVI